MARKSRETKKELTELAARLEEIKVLNEMAEAEEMETLKKMKDKIDNICTTNNLFCGYVLDTNRCLSLLKTAIENGGNVRIPFELYYIE